MTNVTCGLFAKKPGSIPCATLVIEYRMAGLLYFYMLHIKITCIFLE